MSQTLACSTVLIVPVSSAETKGKTLLATALIAAAAFGLTVLFMPGVLAGLRRLDALDHPNERSSHDVPTLRGGGVGPWLACLGVLGVTPGIDGQVRTALFIAAGGFGLLGLVEDLRGLPPSRRFLVQLIVALAAAVALHPLLSSVTWSIPLLALAVLWIVAYVNAFNFMDGINGISAAQAVAAGTGLALMGWQVDGAQLTLAGALLAGAALGFAPFNFPNARTFLGDAGSYFLGGWLALLAIVSLRAGVPVEAVAAPFLLYLADTGTTLVKRVLRGEAWYEPHRNHVYQRLTQLGWSHARVTAWVFIAILGCSALGAAAIGASLPGRIGAMTGMTAIVVAYLASPVLVDRFDSRRTAKL
jgi:UDP-GlcNAc:undecaprenyl-phosphate/decaprenyl-phosphate GlcNAc-1-phosphate transferase